MHLLTEMRPAHTHTHGNEASTHTHTWEWGQHAHTHMGMRPAHTHTQTKGHLLAWFPALMREVRISLTPPPSCTGNQAKYLQTIFVSGNVVVNWEDESWSYEERSELHQGVVTYMSPVEAFMTRIKIFDWQKLCLIGWLYLLSSWLLDF